MGLCWRLVIRDELVNLAGKSFTPSVVHAPLIKPSHIKEESEKDTPASRRVRRTILQPKAPVRRKLNTRGLPGRGVRTNSWILGKGLWLCRRPGITYWIQQHPTADPQKRNIYRSTLQLQHLAARPYQFLVQSICTRRQNNECGDFSFLNEIRLVTSIRE